MLQTKSLGRRTYVAVAPTHDVTFKSCWYNYNNGAPRNSTATQYFTLPGLFHVESMEGGMDCRNSMEWGDGFHGMGDGFHGMGDGFHTFSRWIPYLFQMDSIFFLDGFHTISIWNPGGISSWNHNSSLIPSSPNLARGGLRYW